MILGTRDVVDIIGRVGYSGIHDPWLDKQIEEIEDLNFWEEDDEEKPFWKDTDFKFEAEPSEEVEEPEVPTGAERARVQHGVGGGRDIEDISSVERAYVQHGAQPKFNSGRWRKDYENGRIPLAAMDEVAPGHYLRPDAAASWKRMRRAARKDGVSLTMTGGYRPYEVQVSLAQEKGIYGQGGLAAVPGTSDHGWGEAVDAGEGQQRAWLAKNGRRFGWVMDTPGEPWHFGYKGSNEKVRADRKPRTRRNAPLRHRVRTPGKEGSVQAIEDVGFAPEFSAVTALPGAVLAALNSPPTVLVQPRQRGRKGKGGGGGGGALPNWVPARYRDDIAAAARATGLPAGLLAAVAKKESGFQPKVTSSAGAIGIMQLMPGTAAGLNVDPWNVRQNIMGGARYLAQMVKLAKGNYRLALAMYNAGPNQSRSFLQSRFSVYSDPVLATWRKG